jgi:hypothetical protein
MCWQVLQSFGVKYDKFNKHGLPSYKVYWM